MHLRILSSILVAVFLYVCLNNFEYFASFFEPIAKYFFCIILSWKLGSHVLQELFSRFLPRTNPSDKAVLITGCDTGFGNLSAKLLNKYGFRVYATCLNADSDGASDLKVNCKYPKKMHILQMNVSNDDQIEKCLLLVKENLNQNNCKLWGEYLILHFLSILVKIC